MANEGLDHGTRWAEARSLLDRVPTPSAEDRLRRTRRFRMLGVAAALVGLTALAVVIVVVFRDAIVASRPEDVPTWQVVAGFLVAVAGLVVQLGGLVVLLRTNRRLRAFRSPLFVLTRDQRKDLLAQVRGRRPANPDQLPLTRYLAEVLLSQRMILVSNAGLVVASVGLWIVEPSTWRLLLIGVTGLPWVAIWPLYRRQSRQAREFLARYPADEAAA